MDEVEAGREREEMCVICLYSLERLAVVEERMRDDATQLARGGEEKCWTEGDAMEIRGKRLRRCR